jgi:hypothetical protein
MLSFDLVVLVLLHYSPVPGVQSLPWQDLLPSARPPLNPSLNDGQPTPPKELPPSTKFRVAKMTVLPPVLSVSSQCNVLPPGYDFCKHGCGIMPRGYTWRIFVAEIFPNQPFTVRVVNTSTKTRRLPKIMVLGHAIPHPKAVVALIEDPDVSEDPIGGDDEHARKELSPMEYGLQRDPPPLPDRLIE